MRRFRIAVAAVFSAAIVVAVAPAVAANAATGAPGAAGTGAIWSTAHTSTSGCPSTMHVLVPNKSAGYFASHPQDLMVPGGFNSSNAKLLKDVAARPMHWLSSVTCRPGRPGSPAPKRSVLNDVSHNWSGYVTGIDRGYIGATMEWPVHALTNTTPSNVVTSTWPGIGTGDNSSDALIQAGIQQELPCDTVRGVRTCSSQSNTPWFEIFPQESEQDISNLTVNVSDLIGVIVEYDPLQGLAYFEIDDLTSDTGVYAYQYLEADSSGFIGSGSQAEWIVERPTSCFIGLCYLTALGNFGTLPIVDAESADGLWSQPTYRLAGDDGSFSRQMKNCAETMLLADPGALTSGENFNVTWKNYGASEGC